MVTNIHPQRSRRLGVGYLRAFEAVARLLNFRAASEELALTQSAVSRQIQALEDEVGVSLFLRHTRSVELTLAGQQLLNAVSQSLPRLDTAVRQIRHHAGRRSISVTTFASLASMWLIPRLEAFQRQHPDIDIRVDASDNFVDLEDSDLDLALRFAPNSPAPAGAERLFGEQLAPMASPWLIKGQAAIRHASDLAQFTWIEEGQALGSSPGWQQWTVAQGQLALTPTRWLYFNYTYQMTQAALSGQGVVLARLPLVAENLERGELVEVLPGARLLAPHAYWLLLAPRSKARPEVQALRNWLMAQAELTRRSVGET